MKVFDLLKERTTFSFEFYPAKTPEASENLFETIRNLVPLEPSYVSVTYGAGGSTRELTHDLGGAYSPRDPPDSGAAP